MAIHTQLLIGMIRMIALVTVFTTRGSNLGNRLPVILWLGMAFLATSRQCFTKGVDSACLQHQSKLDQFYCQVGAFQSRCRGWVIQSIPITVDTECILLSVKFEVMYCIISM
jgi:hypothetical protein